MIPLPLISNFQTKKKKGELPRGPHMSNSLGNLVRAFSYHEKRNRLEPMRAKEVEQTTKIVSDLSTTLKTIFMI